MVPKTLKENLEWRKHLRDEAAMNENLQQQLIAACRESMLFWINAFVWTYRPKMPNEQGDEINLKDEATHWPLITWPVQDEFCELLNLCIDQGEDAAVEKSRDMGASWMGLCVLTHRWLFFGMQAFLLMSRKEVLVDQRGDMDSLFEKIRYILKWMPRWLRPNNVRDNYMQLENKDNGSSFTGESTNQNAGQAARKTAAFLDEWARVPNAHDIAASLADTTACRIFNSTHQGPGTHFQEVLTQKRAKILRMPWWRHPEKALGAHQIFDPENGKVKWTSPWYVKECARRSKKDIAQNLDMDPGSSGDIFFDPGELDRHRRDHEKAPRNRGNLKLLLDLTEDEKKAVLSEFDTDKLAFIQDWGHGGWRLWTELSEHDGRPSQQLTYVIAADIANGSGGSNSVLSVACRETRQIVAKFWDAFTSPEALAEIAMLAGLWFGGLHAPAFLIWENNGPGSIFGRKVVQWKYPHYYCQKIISTKREKKTERWGWHSTKETKELLLGDYRQAIATDRFINPSKEGLDEAGDYIYNDSGLLIPSKLREETSGGMELHGDHVIADSLCNLGLNELPKQRERKVAAPVGSFQARRESANRLKKQSDPWR